MKDIQGIQRGKCNNCECSENRTVEGGSGGLACEYCGHRPVDHVRIMPLGRCRNKDCDCDKYTSDDPNSYSDCEYCGCKPSFHEGADARKNHNLFSHQNMLKLKTLWVQCVRSHQHISSFSHTLPQSTM